MVFYGSIMDIFRYVPSGMNWTFRVRWVLTYKPLRMALVTNENDGDRWGLKIEPP